MRLTHLPKALLQEVNSYQGSLVLSLLCISLDQLKRSKEVPAAIALHCPGLMGWTAYACMHVQQVALCMSINHILHRAPGQICKTDHAD